MPDDQGVQQGGDAGANSGGPNPQGDQQGTPQNTPQDQNQNAAPTGDGGSQGDGGQTHKGFAEPGAGQGNSQGDQPGEAPETYSDFTFPEGVDPQSVDQGLMDLFRQEAKQQGLSQERAQETLTGLMTWKARIDKASDDAWTQAATGWSEVSAQRGLMSSESMAKATAGLKHLDPSGDLSAILQRTGLDKHPAMISAFATVGKTLVADQGLQGATGGNPAGANAPASGELSSVEKIWGRKAIAA